MVSIRPGVLVVQLDSQKADPPDLNLVVGELDADRVLVAACSPQRTGAAGEHQLDSAHIDLDLAAGGLWLDPSDTMTVRADDLAAVGAISGDALARLLRERIARTVPWFHRAYHEPRDTLRNPQVVPYSGRVFDAAEVQNAVSASLDFWLTSGRWSDQLQRELAELVEVRRTVLTNSGSSANLLAISALRSPLLGDRAIPAGSEIITAAVGFPTTINPIVQNECVAVLVDADPTSGNAEVGQIEAAITDRTRAVFLAHTLGNPFDVAAVRRLCDEHGLWLVEDACDALGSTYAGRPVGSFGDMSTLSFYPAHHITTGEGGAVNVRDDPRLVRAVLSLRDWGRDCWCEPGQDNICGKRFVGDFGDLPHGYDHKFVFTHIGYNLKMTDWQAAIGCAQLVKLTEFGASRRDTWGRLRSAFARYQEWFELPAAEPGSDPSWFGFKVLLRPDAPFVRSELTGFLESHGVQTRGIFGGNAPRQPAYRALLDGPDPRLRVIGDLPGSDRLMTDAFFIGVYPGIGPQHAARVADVLDTFASQVRTGDLGRISRAELRTASRTLSPWHKAVRPPSDAS